MSIPPSKEPRPLTPKDWKDAVERAQRQRLFQQHKERVAESNRQLAEKNRDKRFTEEQENVLKQLHERRTKDSHLMIVEVRDNRHEITLDDIEMLEKMIEIEEGETKEVVTGVKQTLVEPDVTDAVKMEMEDPPLPIEEPMKMVEEKEVDVMEPQEKEVIEEKKQEKMEYGYTADVLIQDIFTSDNESKWDRTSVKTEQIRFVFEPIKTEMGFSAPRELRITIHNNPRLKKKKEDDEWVVDRVFQNVSYEIIKIIGTERTVVIDKHGRTAVVISEERTPLQWDDRQFLFHKRTNEITNRIIDTTRVTGSENRLWVFNSFKKDGATANVSSTVNISSTIFTVDLTDIDEYAGRRKVLEAEIARNKHLNDIAIEIAYKYHGDITHHSDILKAKMKESSAILLPVIGKLLGMDPSTLSMENYDKGDLITLFSVLPGDLQKAAREELDKYYDLLGDYQTIKKDDFPTWFNKGEQFVSISESNLENLDRTLEGPRQRVPLSEFKLEVKSDPELEAAESEKEIPRYLHITFHFQSVEQQQEIEELFKYSLQYVVLRVEEHTQRDLEYLQRKVEDDKRSYEEWKAKQAKEE